MVSLSLYIKNDIKDNKFITGKILKTNILKT